MSAVLRASSSTFDVDAFLADCTWKIARVFRRGEQHSFGRERTTVTESGFNVVISNAEFDQFDSQLRDATKFLVENREKLRQLRGLVGADNAVIDFALPKNDNFTESHRLPAELLTAAAACGVSLQISRYPICPDESSE